MKLSFPNIALKWNLIPYYSNDYSHLFHVNELYIHPKHKIYTWAHKQTFIPPSSDSLVT